MQNKLSNAFIFLLSLILAAPSMAQLPDFSKSQFSKQANEAQTTGQSIIKALRSAHLLCEDSVINDYLLHIVHRLVATQPLPRPHFQIFSLFDSDINAFALPGGFMAVYMGLILASESESELAGVLAHEIGHHIGHHHSRIEEEAQRSLLPMAAGVLGGLLLGTQNPQLGEGAIIASLAGYQQRLTHFTRQHEKEADSLGLTLLANAGFDPMGLPLFFQRLSHLQQLHTKYPTYLLTHPPSNIRFYNAKTQASTFSYRQVPDSLAFHLVQARVRLQAALTPKEAERYFAKQLLEKSAQSRLASLYGYALCLLEQPHRWRLAKSALDELIKTTPHEPLFQIAYAQLEQKTGNPKAALHRMQSTFEAHPRNRSIGLLYGKWLVQTARYQSAIGVLKEQLSYSVPPYEALQLLAVAYDRLKQPVQAHLMQAKLLSSQGDWPQALKQLMLAKKHFSNSNPLEIEAVSREIERIEPLVTRS